MIATSSTLILAISLLAMGCAPKSNGPLLVNTTDLNTFESAQQIIVKDGYRDGYINYPLMIYTTQKAHLAAFLIVPQEGTVTLLYPNEYQKDSKVSAGELRVQAAPRTYSKYTTNKSFPMSYFLNRKEPSFRSGRQSYVYVVASRNPFTAAPYEVSPQEFRNLFKASTFDVDQAAEQILGSLLAEQDEDEFAAELVLF